MRAFLVWLVLVSSKASKAVAWLAFDVGHHVFLLVNAADLALALLV